MSFWPFWKTKYYEHSWNFDYCRAFMVTKRPEPDKAIIMGVIMSGTRPKYKCREATREEYLEFIKPKALAQ